MWNRNPLNANGAKLLYKYVCDTKSNFYNDTKTCIVELVTHCIYIIYSIYNVPIYLYMSISLLKIIAGTLW